jgi:hypothetical protein
MSFLTPLFLVGLAALAIPVVIHLIQRERKRVVEFPSLMFVRRIPYQSVRRRRIRNWLLLMVRLSAIALIVAAFARPFLRQPELATRAATGAREVVILLDTSYSMGYAGRWDRAVAAARDAIERLGASDRGSVVLFASQPEVALRSTGDRGRLLSAVDTARPAAGATRYGPALKLAGSILSESPLPRREAILISDFQRAGWLGAEGVRLPGSATLTPVAVAETTETANVAATPVLLQRSTFANQERVTVSAGVLNRSDKAITGLPVSLEVGGRSIQTRQVNVEPNGSTSFAFEPFTISSPETRATVRLPDDALVRDNAFHVVISAARPVRVVLIEREGAPGDASLYMKRALSIGDSPRIDLKVVGAEATSADLKGAGVVILDDVSVSSSLAERLAQFAGGGGGVLVILGERASWPQARAELLPAMPAGFVDRSAGDGARIGSVEYAHPIFELFRAPRSGDFSTARFYGYRALDEKSALTSSPPAPRTPPAASTPRAAPQPLASPAPTPVQVLARFDDGATALVERRVGSGRVLVWTSTLDLFWNDLALKPVFLPFLHRVVRHLAAYKEPPAWLTVGQVVEAPAESSGGAEVALTPSGRRVPLDSEEADVLELTEQGFYEIRRQDSKAGPVTTVASNVDLSESDLTAIDPREIVAAAAGPAGGGAGSALTATLTPEAQERTQRLWWYLMFAGVLLLGLDTMLSNRLSGPV